MKFIKFSKWIILLLYLSTFALTAQKGEWQLFCKTEFVNIEDKIVDIIINQETDEIARVFENPLKPRFEYGEEYQAQTGMILEDGRRFELAINERVLDFRGIYLTTIVQSFKSYQTTLRRYQVKNNALRMVNTREFDHAEINLRVVPQSGNIVLSNDWEGFGSLFEVYTPDFSPLNNYIPFDTGFEQSYWQSNDEHIVIAAHKGGVVKIGLLDVQDAHLVKEYEVQLEENYRLTQVFSTIKTTLISTTKNINGRDVELIAMDNLSEKTLWKKSLNLPLQHKNIGVIGSLDDVFLYASNFTSSENPILKSKIIATNSFNGKDNWIKEELDIYPFELLPYIYFSDCIRAVIFTTLSDNSLVTLLGQINDEGFYQDNIMLVFNRNGQLHSSIKEIAPAKYFKLRQTEETLILITENTTYIYEK